MLHVEVGVDDGVVDVVLVGVRVVETVEIVVGVVEVDKVDEVVGAVEVVDVDEVVGVVVDDSDVLVGSDVGTLVGSVTGVSEAVEMLETSKVDELDGPPAEYHKVSVSTHSAA